jgi:hypothetical protein
MKEKQLKDLKAQLAQLESDLVDTRIDLGDQEIFVLNAAYHLRQKIKRIEKEIA